MNRKGYFPIILCLLLLSYCGTNKKTNYQPSASLSFEVKLDSLDLFDSIRKRLVPVMVYQPKNDNENARRKIIIFSHGYYMNRPGSNREYSYLTEKLAASGYFVASIQHELPTDSLIPSAGIPQVVRMPFWERGSDNILFVLNGFKKTRPDLDYKHLILIGHSNGGDMGMLFAHKHPDLVDKIISLDNRRMPFPRTSQPKVYSLRSSDQAADDGVLPTAAEQEKYGIKIIKLANTIHNNMDNSGTIIQQKEISDYVLQFLREQ